MEEFKYQGLVRDGSSYWDFVFTYEGVALVCLGKNELNWKAKLSIYFIYLIYLPNLQSWLMDSDWKNKILDPSG